MFSHNIFGGEKENWLIAFYGYGQSKAVYEKLYEKVKDTHNIIVFDNPMQDYDTDIYPKDLKEYLENLCAKYTIQKFNSVSFSMGSRLNLYLPLFFPEQLQKIVLVAPDGITTNFWNRTAVNTPWGRKLFDLFTAPGKLYLNTLLVFHKLGIVNKSLYAFSKWNMRDAQRRRSVYNAWMNMRLMRPDLKEVNEQLEKNGIQYISYFGKQDPVIPLSVQQRCVKFFPKQEHILLDNDHNIMNDQLFSLIAKEIKA